jgi:hypothetical protein
MTYRSALPSHGGNMWEGVEYGGTEMQIDAIREPHEIPETVNLAISMAIEVFRLVLREYRFHEIDVFNRMYQAQWRDAFLRKYNITINPVMTQI